MSVSLTSFFFGRPFSSYHKPEHGWGNPGNVSSDESVKQIAEEKEKGGDDGGLDRRVEQRRDEEGKGNDGDSVADKYEQRQERVRIVKDPRSLK